MRQSSIVIAGIMKTFTSRICADDAVKVVEKVREGKATQAEIVEAQESELVASERLRELYDARKLVSAEAGRALRALAMSVDDVYSNFSRLRDTVETIRGQKLTDSAKIKRLQELSEKYAKLVKERSADSEAIDLGQVSPEMLKRIS